SANFRQMCSGRKYARTRRSGTAQWLCRPIRGKKMQEVLQSAESPPAGAEGKAPPALFIQLTVTLAAWREGIAPAAILAPGRSRQATLRARRIALYLLHTCFGFRHAELGEWFRRHSRTVARSCRAVEEMRGCAKANAEIRQYEEVLA